MTKSTKEEILKQALKASKIANKNLKKALELNDAEDVKESKDKGVRLLKG